MIPEVETALILKDRIVYVLDMQRLAGVSRETWTEDKNLWKQWRAALEGRVVFVTDSAGLAITVARDPMLDPKPTAKGAGGRLPTKIPLERKHLPDKPYHVCLGYISGGQAVGLDLAVRNRSILVGGASGFGKTTFLLSILLQMALKHEPEEIQFAVVDLKETDFTGAIANLPHYWRSVAYGLDEAEALIERVEGERLRRKDLMRKAEVSDWLAYNKQDDVEPLPLLLFIVDEAADLEGSVATKTLIGIARKGRAAGIALILGTQLPKSDVIDSHIKVNLPTTIAFRTRSRRDSQVILDQGGAEKLPIDKPGRALTFLSDWHPVQTLYVNREIVNQLIEAENQPAQSILTEEQAFLVRLALDELDGEFNIGRLYRHPNNYVEAEQRHRVSKRKISRWGKQWEQRGWLTEPAHATAPRYMTPKLRALLP
jgi:S-DNA-T family DNA segregation ATPase FtsK/SpoIIIE